MKNNYYLGLDIGTNSVGWAVTDENYNLCTFRKKEMWGVRLFEGANTAEGRRISRGIRRRMERKKQRIKLLQMLFADEMRKVDENFFVRMNESKLHIEDKTINEIHPLFSDKEYSDIEFYRDFPTIYHLRKELICNDRAHDVRFVYLALHHILKNRGHFLIDGDINSAKDFSITFKQMLAALEDEMDIKIYVGSKNEEEIKSILQDKNKANTKKVKEILELVQVDSEEKSIEQIKKDKSLVENLFKFIVGNKGDISKFIDIEELEMEKTSFNFSDGDYEEKIVPELEKKCPEILYIIDKAKSVYDWSILIEVLGDEDYISFAKVKQYEKHKSNLKELKRIIRTYCDKEIYKELFENIDKNDNYVSYIGYTRNNGKRIDVKKCSDEESFYKYLNKILSKINIKQDDKKIFDGIVSESGMFSLLPLQRSKDNGVIPNQVHKLELEKILDNASKYLDFLNNKDDNGLTVKEKIKSIFEYRVPYYVGPLSDRHKISGSNSWIVRKSEGRIYPWNFDKMVDLEKSNEQFIQRMTNKCTYLIGEDVLPKQSILYSKFMVLNELNNMRIRGNKISVELKQKIYNDVFLKHTKISGKMVLNYLIKMEDSSIKEEDLSGFDENFNSSMASYLDFEKKVFGSKIKEKEYEIIADNCIKWITIYGDDKKMIKNIVKTAYGNIISEEQIIAISKLKYSGWGTLSKRFLSEIEGVNTNTGETGTIINLLWITNNNLMQLLSKEFTFIDEIKEYNNDIIGEVGKITYENVVEKLYVSPSVKRSIWQSIQVVEEIKKIQGQAPEKIFVEMARGEDKNKDRNNKKNNKVKSRKQKLLELYAACNDDVRKWTEEINQKDERDFNSIKLYLYYTQKGKCMYTGENIDIDKLMTANSLWDRDHIYPQSKIKDDSLDNLVLVKKVDNAKKSNGLISANIQQNMKSFWKQLLDGEFISQKKYDRLTRREDFTDDELAGFISRQLVETRQSSKAVAELLERIYPDTKVVYVKAGIVSDFRKSPLNMLKSRRLNDFHHAKDAYLNIVVGNVYNTKFTSNPVKWIKDHKNDNYSINKVFYYDVKKGEKAIWIAPNKNRTEKEVNGGTLDIVKNNMKKNTPLYTEYVYCEKGELFNATIAKKSSGAIIPLKKGLDPSKYGGYTSAKTSYFSLIEFDGKKGERIRQIIGVPIYVANMLEHDENAFIDYCINKKQLKNVKVLKEKIKKNSLIRVDGFPMRIRGENDSVISFKNNIQLIVDEKDSETVRLIEHVLDKDGVIQISEKYDKLNEDMMIKLYETFVEKLCSEPYCRRPAKQYNALVNGKDIFMKLGLYDKAVVLNQILNYFRCDIATTGDISKINGTAKAGNMAINKNTVGKSDLLLINESITGLFNNKEKM